MNTGLRVIAGAMALMMSLTITVGCTGGPPEGPVSPGIESGTLGGVEVVGYLTGADGAWTVFDADPSGPDGSEAKALATLVAGSVDEMGIEALAGRYIWAAGRSSDGESYAPEIEVDGIDAAVEPN